MPDKEEPVEAAVCDNGAELDDCIENAEPMLEE